MIQVEVSGKALSGEKKLAGRRKELVAVSCLRGDSIVIQLFDASK